MTLTRRLYVFRRSMAFGPDRWPATGDPLFRSLRLGWLEVRLYRAWPSWVWAESREKHEGCARCHYAASVLRSLAKALEHGQGRR